MLTAVVMTRTAHRHTTGRTARSVVTSTAAGSVAVNAIAPRWQGAGGENQPKERTTDVQTNTHFHVLAARPMRSEGGEFTGEERSAE